MKRPQWLKRKMPVAKNGYVKCEACQLAMFLTWPRMNYKTRCERHR
jgi:hypothetical protein